MKKRSSESITLILITSSLFLASCEDRSDQLSQVPQPEVGPDGTVLVEGDGSSTQPAGTNPAMRNASGSTVRRTGTTYVPLRSSSSSVTRSHTTPYSLGGSLFGGSSSSHSSYSSSPSHSSSHSVSTVHGGFGSSAVSHSSSHSSGS